MTDKELQVLLKEALGDEPEERQPSCPSLEDLARFAENPTPSPFTEPIRAHILDCRRCATEVAHLSLAQENFAKRRGEVRHRIIAMAQGKPAPHASRLTFQSETSFRLSRFTWGLAAAAVLVVVALLALRAFMPAPRKDEIVQRNGNERKPAPPFVRNPNQHSQPPEPPPQPQPPSGKKDKPPPRQLHQPKPPPFLVGISEATKAFLAAASAAGNSRSGGTTDKPPLISLKPNLTIILSQTPELVAKASPDIAGPFIFQVDEVEVVGKGFQGIEGKEDVAQTKGTPVDKPSLTLTKPLERGKVYAWRVSAGERKSEWAYFRVAEQRTVDAARKYAQSPLQLAEFYKAHGLYLDTLNTLDKWLARHPNDAKVQRMKKEIDRLLSF